MFNEYFTSYTSTDPPYNIPEDYIFPKVNILEDMKNINIEDFKNNNFRPIEEIPVTIPEFKTTLTNFKIPKQLPNSSEKPDLSTPEKYAKNMYPYLYNALENNGLDGELWTPILLAQTSVESDWGNKHSQEHNNFAGIKGSNGDLVKTQEWSPEKGYYTILDRFKKYSSIEEFADDFVKRLKNKFNAFKGTPKDYVKNIRSKGYFTDTLEHYSDMMNSRIRKINKLLSV